MEEKHFSWLLKLLSINKSFIPLLDSYPVHKNKILCCFSLGPDNKIHQIPQKFLNFRTVSAGIQAHCKAPNTDSRSTGIYLIQSSIRQEINTSEILKLLNSESDFSRVSFMQITKKTNFRFIKMRVENSRRGHEYIFSPSRMLSRHIAEQAERIYRHILDCVHTIESKDILAIELEFFEDTSQKLWLSYAHSCFISNKENLKTIKASEVKRLQPKYFDEEAENLLELEKTPIKKQSSLKNALSQEKQKLELSGVFSDDSVIAENASPRCNQVSLRMENNKHFIELLSMTRLSQISHTRNPLITEEQYKSEYEKLSQLLNGSNEETDKLITGSGLKFPNFRSTKIQLFSPSPKFSNRKKDLHVYRSSPILRLLSQVRKNK